MSFPPTDSATSIAPVPGAIVGERYRLIERIGEGGMGTVWRAEHTLMRKAVALKTLHADARRDPEAAARFEREAQSASRLAHEGIVQVTDFGHTADGTLFLVMELVRGEPLTDVLARAGRLPPARALAVVRQIAAALEHAHAAGVIHRDLKPDNIFLVEEPGREGRVKLLDFGIAKLSNDDAAGTAALTRAGTVYGTPSYMSPEQAMAEPVDARSDVYACGVILFELVVGRRPFLGDSAVQILAQHLTAAVPAPSTAAPDASIPRPIDRVVLRALEKERDRRFPSATELVAALDEALAEVGPDGGGVASLVAFRGEGRSPTTSRITVTLDLGRARRLLGTALHRSREIGLAAWSRLHDLARGRPRVAVGLAVAAAAAMAALSLRPGAAGPRAIPPEVARALRPIEHALAEEEYDDARRLAKHALAASPDVARLHYLLGAAALSDGDGAEALASFRETLRLDSGYRKDASLAQKLRALLGQRRHAAAALNLLVDEIGEPAAPMVAEAASSRFAAVRHRAVAECAKLGCMERINRARSFDLDLRQAATCDEKLAAVRALRELGGAKALASLRRARDEGKGGDDDEDDDDEDRPAPSRLAACGHAELDEAVRALGGR